jgi:hypothetical protein
VTASGGGWLAGARRGATRQPGRAAPPGERLRRDYFGLHALGEASGAATINLPYGEWVRRFRAHGLAVETLIEPRPPPGSTSVFWAQGTAWARRWQAEPIWMVRREA